MSDISAANILPSRTRSGRAPQSVPPPQPVAKPVQVAMPRPPPILQPVVESEEEEEEQLPKKPRRNNKKAEHRVDYDALAIEVNEWMKQVYEDLNTWFMAPSFGSRNVHRLVKKSSRRELKTVLFNQLQDSIDIEDTTRSFKNTRAYSSLYRRFQGFRTLLNLEYKTVHKQFNLWKSLKSEPLSEDHQFFLELFKEHNLLLTKFFVGERYNKKDWVTGNQICRRFKQFVIETNFDNKVVNDLILVVHQGVREFNALKKVWQKI
jgi:hypothetical protein